jgi:hypothetical protein
VANGSQDIPYDDDMSVYSVATATIPNYGRSSNIVVDKPEDIAGSSSIRNLVQRTPRLLGDNSNATDGRSDRRSMDSVTDPFMYQRSRSQNSSPLPTVVVSDDLDDAVNGYEHEQGERTVQSEP